LAARASVKSRFGAWRADPATKPPHLSTAERGPVIRMLERNFRVEDDFYRASGNTYL